MVLTNLQNTAFFTQAAQIGPASNARAQLVIEGIWTTEDLFNSEDHNWDQFALSCRRPGRILDANGNLVN